jgi:hypothetical protein
MNTSRVALNCLFSSPTGPRQTGPRKAWWPQCTRTPKRSGRLATASSAWPNRHGMAQLQSPANRAGEIDGGVLRVHGDVQPAARRRLGMAAQRSELLELAMATELPRRALVFTKRMLRCMRVHAFAPPVRPLPQNGPCTRHCVVVLCSAAAIGLCRTDTSDGVRRRGAPRWPRRRRAPAAAKRAG